MFTTHCFTLGNHRDPKSKSLVKVCAMFLSFSSLFMEVVCFDFHRVDIRHLYLNVFPIII